MGTDRWRFTLVEETDVRELEPDLPIGRRTRGRRAQFDEFDERGAAALVAAIELLRMRGAGAEAFTLSPSNDPIAFLLDATADAVSVWCGASVLYRNRAADLMEPAARSLERRGHRFRLGDAEYVLEITSHRK